MPFNSLWGVGKDARTSISPIVTTIGTAVKNFDPVTPSNERTTLLTQRILFIFVTLSMKQDVAGTATGQFFNILVDGRTIASYAPSGSNQTDWQVAEIIPMDIEAVNSSVFLNFGCTGETGDYGVVARVQVYGISID